MHSITLCGIALAALLGVGGCDSPATKPEPPRPPPASETELVTALERAYASLDANALASLLHPEFGVFTEFDGWCRETHVCMHERMFASAHGVAVDPPVNPAVALESLAVHIVPQGAFAPVSNYYRTPGFEAGLDPEVWRLSAATCQISALINTRGETDYRAFAPAALLVAEDLTKPAGAAGKFTLFRWDETPGITAPATEARGFCRILPLYGEGCPVCPGGPPRPPVPDVIRSAEELVQAAAAGLAARAPAAYGDLLADDFRFYVSASVVGPRYWDRAEELRILSRMTHPETYAGTSQPVPPDLWPTALEFGMTIVSGFTERPEYYVSSINPSGLDPARWHVASAEYGCDGTLHTADGGAHEFHSTARAVVAEDLQAPRNSQSRFRLYRWLDTNVSARGSHATAPAGSPPSWSDIKLLYQ